jgi:uncharacterized protein with HEPN domain
MSSDAPRLTDYLEHITQAIDRVERYTAALDEGAFRRDELVQDAVIRNLEVIGEAARSIRTRYPDFATAHPELPLAAAYQMRNALAHGYFQVDLRIVWSTLRGDLPALRDRIVERLAAIRSAPPPLAER